MNHRAQRSSTDLFIAVGVFAPYRFAPRLYGKFRLVREIGVIVKDALIRVWS